MQSFGVTTSALASMMTSYAEVSFEGDEACNNADTGIATHSKVIRPSLLVLGDTTIERYVTLAIPSTFSMVSPVHDQDSEHPAAF
jgi:hypothetical protein